MAIDEKIQVVDFEDTATAFRHKTDAELKKAVWLFRLMNNPRLVETGSSLGMLALKLRLPFAKTAIRHTIFEQFCGGANLDETRRSIEQLYEHRVLTILDFGAEAKDREEDLEHTRAETRKAIDFGATNLSVPVVSSKVSGMVRFGLLEKKQTREDLSPQEQAEWERALARVDEVCAHAAAQGVGIFFDAEESWVQDAIDMIVEGMMEKYNKEKVSIYATFQMYRHDRLAYLLKSHHRALERGYLLGAKIVRGAYMDKERDRAKAQGYPSPIQPDKEATDRDYNEALQYCLENYTTIASCNATHNAFSSYFQAEMIAQLGLPKTHPHINFCQLYGMSDNITFNLAAQGFNAAKYMPYGAIRDVVPYLIRRAKENSSVTGEMSRELQLLQREIARRKLPHSNPFQQAS